MHLLSHKVGTTSSPVAGTCTWLCWPSPCWPALRFLGILHRHRQQPPPAPACQSLRSSFRCPCRKPGSRRFLRRGLLSAAATPPTSPVALDAAFSPRRSAPKRRWRAALGPQGDHAAPTRPLAPAVLLPGTPPLGAPSPPDSGAASPAHSRPPLLSTVDAVETVPPKRQCDLSRWLVPCCWVEDHADMATSSTGGAQYGRAADGDPA